METECYVQIISHLRMEMNYVQKCPVDLTMQISLTSSHGRESYVLSMGDKAALYKAL